MRIALKAFNVCEVAGLADEQAELGAFFRECAGDVIADKSGGAGEEYLHGLASHQVGESASQ